MRTAECGYRYLVVIGHDTGDRFFDSHPHHDEIRTWLEAEVIGPTRARRIDMSVVFVACDNPIRKPGPVFAQMTAEAHARQADWIYRVNDDTELLDPWTTPFIQTLLALGPPYGVVGPVVCNKGGNRKILTHDFVHKTHMEVFDRNYYPPELVDWWMDNWVSRVYGSKRTVLMSKVTVGHRTTVHGRRYTVDARNQLHLEALVRVGGAQIVAWMRRHGTPLDNIKAFLNDSFTGEKVEVPRGSYRTCDVAMPGAAVAAAAPQAKGKNRTPAPVNRAAGTAPKWSLAQRASKHRRLV